MEKCLSSSVHQLSAAVGLRRVFESIASGILLPGTNTRSLYSNYLHTCCL